MNRRSLTKLGPCFVFSIMFGSITFAETSVKTSPNSARSKMDREEEEDIQLKKDQLESKNYKAPLKMTATTLDKIVEEALTYHPSIEADKVALSATDEVIDQAMAGYMPTVDLRVSLGRENIRRNFNINSLSPQTSVGALSTTRNDPSITIRQILFDGMATASRVERARSQRHQAHGTLGITTDVATIDAATVTIDVRRLQRLLRIVDNNIHFHEIMRARVAEIVEAGAAPLSDLFQVDARLQDTFISKSNIQSDLEVAQAKFIEVVGKQAPTVIKRIALPSYLSAGSPEMAVRMGLDNNNAIKVAKSNVQIAETNHRETASKLVPTLTFEFEGERTRNVSATSGSQSRLTAMVVARHNVFNGGADMAKSRETVKRLTETHARLSLARRQTERAIRAAWGEARSARAKSAHLTNLIREKRNIRDTYLVEFPLGKRSLIDLLDAANDVFITEASRTTADATADINTVTLSVGTGQFMRYVRKTGPAENEESETDDSYTSYPEAPLSMTAYREPLSLKNIKESKSKALKNIALKRKSLFEKRKELRQNDLQTKENS